MLKNALLNDTKYENFDISQVLLNINELVCKMD